MIVRVLLISCAWLPAYDAAAQDFDSDGVRDMVVGVPYEDYWHPQLFGPHVKNAGAVDVIYGSAGPRHVPIQPQHWTLASAGVPGSPQAGDRLGFAVAWGRFNGDQYLDLAIGIPGRDVDGIEAAGAILILYGSTHGLVASGPWMEAAPVLLRQGADDVPGVPKHGDNFGHALAAGNWWDTGGFYLAVGAPGYSAGNNGDQGRGEVNVLYFDSHSSNQLWTQVVGSPEPHDWFGFSLATGDFGHSLSGNDGLAIGVPGEDVDGGTNAGAVEVLYMPVSDDFGVPRVLRSDGALLLRQSTFVDVTQSQSWFGFSLAAGDLNGQLLSSFRDELVIGEPFRDVGLAQSAGVVHVIYGGNAGLEIASTATLKQGTGPSLQPEPYDFFGFSVVILDDDILAVGSPGEDYNGQFVQVADAGSVHIFHGGPMGLTGDQRITDPVVYWQFGWSLQAAGDRLLVGAPASLDGGGAVQRFRLTTGPNNFKSFVQDGVWTQDSVFGNEHTEPGDNFGFSLGAGGWPLIQFPFP